MAIDNSNPFYVPVVRKQSFLKKPVPLWSLGAALILGSLISFGFTTLTKGETVDAQAQSSQTSSEAPALPSSAGSTPNANTQGFPASPQLGAQADATIGETTTNHGVRLTVDSVEVVRELSMTKKYSSDETETITPNNEGAKFIRVNVTVANDGKEGFDLSCRLRSSTALENSQGQQYKAISDIYRIPGNPGCLSSDSIAPGFEGKISYVYEVPDSFEWGNFTYFDPSVYEARKNPTLIRLDNAE
ncbi:DUF4352 domain-containing protein [Corynebacterium guaraldiae]